MSIKRDMVNKENSGIIYFQSKACKISESEVIGNVCIVYRKG